MTLRRKLAQAMVVATALSFALPAFAADWWPFTVVPDGPDKKPMQPIEYVPLEKASKK